jgi:long-chain acyl-CoA synthetase
MATMATTQAVPESTLAQLFRARSATYGKATRWRQKVGDKWMTMTWRENLVLVNSLIAGLDALGARPGDAIGILSGTRWEWTAADWAIIGLGGVCVTVYPSNLAPLVAYICNDSDIRYLFAENRAQYQKLLGIRGQIPNVRKVILFEDAASAAGDPWVMSFNELRHLSPRSLKEADAFAAARAAAIRPEDRFTLVYTSGTTGNPKGVVHTHGTFMAQIRAVRAALDTIRPGMTDLLFLPLSHVFGREEHLSGFDRGLSTVISPNIDHLIADLEHAQPDLFFSVPRIYEKAYAAIQARVEAGSRTRKRIFRWAERVGLEAAAHKEAGKKLPSRLRRRYWLADRLVFKKIRAVLGGNLKFAITAGAPLELKILQFFNAAGVLLLEGWGLTETSGGMTLNRVNRSRFGTVGLTYDGHATRIAEDGEILARGPCLFTGYHNNPAATAEALDADGWFHTGDIGTLDAEGFLRIVDRKKDLIITAAGKNIAPQNVENALKTAPMVSQIAVYGDRRPYLVALVTLDPEQVQAWCAEHGLPFTSVANVYTNPQLRADLDAGLQAAGKQLASYETVKYYEVLPDDFTLENELLTPTLKIRRRNIHKQYADLYASLYRPTKSQA